MSVGSVSSSVENFFLHPTHLVKESGLAAKVGMVTLSVFVGILTLGIGHLIALGIRSWKSGGAPGAKKAHDTALKLLQGPLQQRLATEAAVTQQKDVQVPVFVRSCIAFLEKGKNLDTVGIYRQATLATLPDTVERQYVKRISQTRTKPQPLEQLQAVRSRDNSADQVHLVANTLKHYCRGMWGWSVEKLKAPETKNPPDISQNLEPAQKRLQELPQEERAVLLEIFTHLRKVMEKSVVNRMDAKNLDIAWAPSLPVDPGDITYLVGHPEVNLQQFLGLEGK